MCFIKYRILFTIPVLFILAAFPVFAKEEARIAVLDFEVQSDNPSFKYLGKGFAEFLAVELASAEGITIIEREKRNALLKEQEFALSDMADETRQLKIGNLLSANYLLTGDIFDVFGDLTVTIKLLDVENGSVVVSEKADAPPKKYKRVITALSRAVIASLDLKVQPTVAEAEEVEEEQAEEVLTAFSEAMDAVDRNDVTEASKSLRRAEKIDRTNKAVEYYLNKLFAASPKFNVELVYYAPSFNPAYLGFVEKDRLYITTSTNWASFFHVTYPNETGDDTHSHFNWIVVPGLYYYLGILKSELGYYMPFGQRWGLGVELAFGDVSNITRDENYTTPLVSPGDDIYLSSMAGTVGGRVSAGFRILENMALGISGYIFNSHTNLGGIDGPDDPKSNTLTASVTLGFYSRLMEGKLTLGSHVTVPFLQEVYLDYSIKDYVAYKTAPYPVVWETSVVGAALNSRLYLSLKEVAEFYTSFGEDDRRGIAARTIPALEWWPAHFISLRIGGEYDFLFLTDKINHGFGILGGLTIRRRSFDLDVNYTLMQRTLRFYPGLTAPDGTLLVQASWNGTWIKERD